MPNFLKWLLILPSWLFIWFLSYAVIKFIFLIFSYDGTDSTIVWIEIIVNGTASYIAMVTAVGIAPNNKKFISIIFMGFIIVLTAFALLIRYKQIISGNTELFSFETIESLAGNLSALVGSGFATYLIITDGDWEL